MSRCGWEADISGWRRNKAENLLGASEQTVEDQSKQLEDLTRKVRPSLSPLFVPLIAQRYIRR